MMSEMRRILIADPGLPHQIILNFDQSEIYVTCNCLRNNNFGAPGAHRYARIDQRMIFPAKEAIAVYRQWHASRGIELAS
jgi:hypothetical protein